MRRAAYLEVKAVSASAPAACVIGQVQKDCNSVSGVKLEGNISAVQRVVT